MGLRQQGKKLKEIAQIMVLKAKNGQEI